MEMKKKNILVVNEDQSIFETIRNILLVGGYSVEDDETGWSAGSYQDEFVRTPEGWKIKRKVITFSFRR